MAKKKYKVIMVSYKELEDKLNEFDESGYVPIQMEFLSGTFHVVLQAEESFSFPDAPAQLAEDAESIGIGLDSEGEETTEE